MIEHNRDESLWEASCDNCTSYAVESSRGLRLVEFVGQLRKEGWKTKKVISRKGVVEHLLLCPDCLEQHGTKLFNTLVVD